MTCSVAKCHVEAKTWVRGRWLCPEHLALADGSVGEQMSMMIGAAK